MPVNISPFEAARMVTFSPDGKTARLNQFGIGYGQRGFWGNIHYPDLATAEAALNVRLADLREVYGKPGRGWTGRFDEVEETPAGPTLIRVVRFYPILKIGKRGSTVHTVHLYRIPTRQPDYVQAIRDALRPVEFVD